MAKKRIRIIALYLDWPIIQKENGIPIHDTRCTTPRVERIKKAPAEQRLINQSRVCAQKSLYCQIEDWRLIEGMILVHAPVYIHRTQRGSKLTKCLSISPTVF